MEGKWGLIPDMGGTLALREVTHRDQAMKLAMTAAEVSADRALSMGLITEIAESPVDRAIALARDLLERSPDAIAATKKLYDRSWNGSRGMALARETFYQIRVIAGPNQRIAVKRAFGEDIPYQRGRKI